MSGPASLGAVLFDLDGTLLDHAGASAAALSAALGTAPETGIEVAQQLWRELEAAAMDRYLRGEISFRQQRRVRVAGLAERLGLDIRGDEQADAWFSGYLQAYEASWRPYDDVAPLLARLVTELPELSLGVVTNGDGQQQRRKLRSLGLDLGLVIASGDVGVAKPGREIFALACERLGRPAGQVLYVGDNLATDALGARAAGLFGVWLDRAGQATQGLPVPVIRTLDGLPDLLRPSTRWPAPTTRPGR